MAMISFYTEEQEIPKDDGIFLVDLLANLTKGGYPVRDLNPDKYCSSIQELDSFGLVTNLCKELEIKNPFTIYMLFGKNLLEPVDCAFFFSFGDVPRQFSSLCNMADIPFINLGNKEVQGMFKDNMNNCAQFLRNQLTTFQKKPHGLCLSFGFCPF